MLFRQLSILKSPDLQARSILGCVVERKYGKLDRKYEDQKAPGNLKQGPLESPEINAETAPRSHRRIGSCVGSFYTAGTPKADEKHNNAQVAVD